MVSCTEEGPSRCRNWLGNRGEIESKYGVGVFRVSLSLLPWSCSTGIIQSSKGQDKAYAFHKQRFKMGKTLAIRYIDSYISKSSLHESRILFNSLARLGLHLVVGLYLTSTTTSPPQLGLVRLSFWGLGAVRALHIRGICFAVCMV